MDSADKTKRKRQKMDWSLWVNSQQCHDALREIEIEMVQSCGGIFTTEELISFCERKFNNASLVGTILRLEGHPVWKNTLFGRTPCLERHPVWKDTLFGK